LKLNKVIFLVPFQLLYTAHTPLSIRQHVEQISVNVFLPTCLNVFIPVTFSTFSLIFLERFYIYDTGWSWVVQRGRAAGQSDVDVSLSQQLVDDDWRRSTPAALHRTDDRLQHDRCASRHRQLHMLTDDQRPWFNLQENRSWVQYIT